MIELNGSHTFAASPQEVWEALMNPDLIAKALPGCQGMEKVGDNEYRTTLNMRVGPVQGRFNGTVEILDAQPPHSYQMKVKGSGPAGFVDGVGDVTLSDDDGQTVLRYTGSAQVGGRIASVGQRLLDTSASALTRQGVETFDKLVQAMKIQPDPATVSPTQTPEVKQAEQERGEDAPTPTTFTRRPIPDIQPPGQTAFALGVAKNMFEESVPAAYRPAVLGVLAYVGMAAFVRFLRWAICDCR